MKNLILTLFILLSFCSFAQQKTDQKPVDSTKVVVLTKWQEERLIAYDNQIKILQEQQKLLFNAIMDINKVDPEKIKSMGYQSGKLILIINK